MKRAVTKNETISRYLQNMRKLEKPKLFSQMSSGRAKPQGPEKPAFISKQTDLGCEEPSWMK
jgi:hypothetical protein